MLQTNKSYSQMDQDTITTSVTGSISDTIPFRQNRRSRYVISTYIPNHRFSRYHNTLLSLLPFRLTQNDELSVQNSSLFSFMTFHWIFKYLWQSIRNQAGVSIPCCPHSESCTVNSARINGLLDDQVTIQGQQGLSIFSVIWRFIRTRTIFACFLYILGSLLSMVGLIYLLPKILPYCKCENEKIEVYWWMLALVCTELMSSFLTSCSNAINLRTAIRLRSACFSSLYRQAMITSLTYKISSWQLASFLLSDGQHIQDLVMTFPNLICTPFILTFCMLFAGVHLGLWGYMSVIIIIIFFPIFILLAYLSKNLLYRATIFSDQRIRLLEDFIIHNIYVKFFKQEGWFQDNIAEKRDKEVRNMKRAGLYENICFSFILLQPFLSLAAIFIAYHSDNWNKNDKNDHKTQFAAISIILLIHMKQSLDNFWYGLNNFIKGLAAFKKFKKIMTCDTINLNNKKPKNSNLAIHIEEASFQWTKQVTLDINSSRANILCELKSDIVTLGNKLPVHDILHDINMAIEHGQLIGICGLPGSGKSSLLLAVMGLLLQSKGKRKTIGHFAYANQDPIIFQDSLKNNILFGSELDSQRYFRVTMYCELQDFISRLPEQDDTIIESKLLTLEQKQRIVLARALYEDGEIYLLDEPLSALDPRKAAKIFDNCVIKSLQQKTVLLVTDNIEFLQQCSEVFMMQHGIILFQGQHQKLVQYDPEYRKFMEYLLKQKHSSREKSNYLEVTRDIPRSPNDIRLRTYSSNYSIFGSTDTLSIDQADNFNFTSRDIGEDNNVLKFYLLHFGLCSLIILFLTQILNVTFISFLPVYFIFSLENKENVTNLSVYSGLLLCMLTFGVIMNYYFNNKMFSASIRIHNEILQKLYSATLAFFQAKSLSIISIVSIQQQLTDIDIPRLIHNIFLNSFIAIMTSCVIFFASPWSIFSTAVIFTMMIICTAFIRKALLPFNQFGMDYTEILYTQVMTMLMARPIIQAYNKINHFSKSLYSSYDKYMTYLYIIHAAKGWLIFVLQCFTVLLLACVGYISLLLNPECSAGGSKLFKSNITPMSDIPCVYTSEGNSTTTANTNCHTNIQNLSCIALAIVCTLQACYALQKTLSLYLSAGLAFDMLSKVQTFKMSITKEENEDDAIDKIRLEEKAYSIKFVKATLQLEIPVLHEISFKVKENEKMGFYGLTSSERKAIIAVLYKLNDLTYGSVLIGKKNITKIAMTNLRSLISIIPAEPYLFSMSIKKILTVQNGLSMDLVEVLQKFMLVERVSLLPNKMDAIADQLLNAEEKQLLCLAQAYIKQSPIVVIEDFMNGSNLEYIISTQIKELFPQSTVLIFANDVSSLRDCDTISVFQNGKAIYSNEPKSTIANLSPHLTVFEVPVPETSF